MRLTASMSHVQRYWWGKGWGSKPGKNIYPRMFKIQWKAKSKRQILEYEQTLPANVTVEDANQLVRDEFRKECMSGDRPDFEGKQYPWPYSARPTKGLSDDPRYQSRPALVFSRSRRLLDPLNQSLHFTNTSLEGDQQLPECLSRLIDDIEIDDRVIDLTRRRLLWSTDGDSIMRKLPLNRTFPALDQRPPRVYGIPENRKELNYLRTIHDSSQMLLSQTFGFVDIQKISYPYCVVPFERNERLVVYDLETDFITVSKRGNSLGLFSTTPLVTIDKPLASIEPLSWSTCFLEKNIYPTDYSFEMADNRDVHTLYFTHNHLRQLDSTSIVGRAIHYCYGYAVAMARRSFGEEINGKEIPDPIPIQCIFINPKDFSLGFVCFQLNTTSFDSSLKNQVWIKSDVKELSEVIRHCLAFQANGFVDPVTKQLKTVNNI